jgi:hypothetical protein
MTTFRLILLGSLVAWGLAALIESTATAGAAILRVLSGLWTAGRGGLGFAVEWICPVNGA